ncbi:protein NO VEIN domain-containing protein [Leuconostoc suionicum]|uniref:protein NO VEIN domain-containing protein n=1 Tax=Leuconostoc suionicum TaxID=1511761 RepID=UPI003749A6FD
MTGFFVSQNQTYKTEHEKQILWSPQKNKIGGDNRGYINMSNVKKGDIIFHYHHKQITHVSIALTNVYERIRPSEFNNSIWDELGWQVDVSMYKLNLNMEEVRSFLQKHDAEIFNTHGHVNQMYLFRLTKEQLDYLMNYVTSDIKKSLERDIKSTSSPSVTLITHTSKRHSTKKHQSDRIDYLKLHELKSKIGKLGEEFILDYLTKKYPESEFDIIPTSNNLNTLSGDDSAGFDIKIVNKTTASITLIDVKTTTSTSTPPFFMSQKEYQVFRESLDMSNTNYYIYRLSNLNELHKTYDLEILGPDELSEAIFTPNAYSVSF